MCAAAPVLAVSLWSGVGGLAVATGPSAGAALIQAADRLRDLREAQITCVDAGGNYHLTPLGERLHDALAPRQDWASAWAEQLTS